LLETDSISQTHEISEYLEMIKSLDYTNLDPLSWYQTAYPDIATMEEEGKKRLFVIHYINSRFAPLFKHLYLPAKSTNLEDLLHL